MTYILCIVIYLLKQVNYVELHVVKEMTYSSKGSFAKIVDYPYMVLVSVTKKYESEKVN